MTEPIKLPPLPMPDGTAYGPHRTAEHYFLHAKMRDYARLYVEQATAELRAELEDMEQRALSEWHQKLEAQERAEKAEAELARLTTLRPASEHDGKPAIWWLNSVGNWLRISESRFGMDHCYWTPLPEPKEADK
jgi:hypothetical protein